LRDQHGAREPRSRQLRKWCTSEYVMNTQIQFIPSILFEWFMMFLSSSLGVR
jgi:hypothetical protein